jgi:hypothetical protein
MQFVVLYYHEHELRKCLFLVIIVQLEHDQRDVMKVFWSTLEQSRPFTETLRNLTDSIMYLDVYILLTITVNFTRHENYD